MNITDEQDIFAIRVDQNNGAYFKAFRGQRFKSKDGDLVREIVDIYLDRNELIMTKRRIYKIKAVSPEGITYLWQQFEDCTNVNIIYRDPDQEELEQINELFNGYESTWD